MFERLFDFIKGRRRVGEEYFSGWQPQGVNYVDLADGLGLKKDKRKVKKPIDVVEEIITKVPKINLSDINKNIKIVKKRIVDLKRIRVSPSDEKKALAYLEARKSFIKYKDLFKWRVTTTQLVDKLCRKYKMQMTSINMSYKNLPSKAFDELNKFQDAYKKVSKAIPEFVLIVDEGGPEDKKDPILLANSPFGQWWYVIGAWDEPVAVIDSILYEGK